MEQRLLRPPPARTVQRPGVDRLLDVDPAERLTVVAAGAGWGKSTAVASWATAQPGPVGWIALEPRDTVPQALASRVLDALRGSGAVPAEHELARLRVPPTSTPAFVSRWVRGLVALPVPVTLVLDDLDVVRHRNVVQTVRDLLAADVPLRLVLLSRAEPSIERRTATRVAAEDLAFTAAEVRSLAELEGVEVSPQDARTILERTRGWPTGVRIALSRLARLQAGEAEADLADALDDDRAVADYLVGEVLDRQPPAVRSFLLRSSVVPTFTPELARALSPSATQDRLHEALTAAHDFVSPVPADRAALRYHPLLREILHSTLRVRDPEGHRDAHACAARWLLRHGSPVAALDHATEAERWELLGRVLAEAAAPLLVGPGREAVRETLAQLPYDELPAAEWTELCAAALALVDRAYPACRTHVARVRALRTRVRSTPVAADVLTDLLDAASARGLGDVAAQVRASTSAVDALARVEWPFPAYGGYLRSAHELRGSALLWLGDGAAARRELAASVAEEPDVVDFTSLSARANLALAHAALGGLDAAEREAHAAVDLAAASGWTSYTYVRPAYAALAWVALLRGRWADADRAVAYGFAASDTGSDPASLAALHALQVLIALSRGRLRAARAALDVSRAAGPAVPLVAELRLRGEVEVEGGGGPDATARGGVIRISSPIEALVAGRRSLARADLGGARRHARVAAGWAADLADPLTETEACLVLAEVAEQRHAGRLAEDLVRRAMSVAGPERLLRPFVSGTGPCVGAVLGRVLPGRTDALSREVLGHLRTPAPVTEPEPLPSVLTDRELTVLAALPTMASNTEIAEDLVVSVNTVKAHLKSLYRKLDVPTRRAAVARGRELGLLP
jgi:LuxR family maltose regulon positive regulatory protein